ncbi:hypothetical protein ABFP00_17045 [Acinetobacter baumannii]|uniref:hypothetical protein n=2 Tax=Acinetobacter baumannii TaxID=470 RepID=UPI00044F4A24|nr:hypothetical protein [Acinetobacter baumannii]EXB30050.1 putative membrane protein [Acinetobacter baumannii 1419130]
MNTPNPTELNQQTEALSKYLSLLFKIGTFLGALCFTLYCHNLNYFPTGVTISDSLLFIIFAGSFCLIYGFMIICLLSLGVCMTYVLKPLFKFIHKHYKRYKLNKGTSEVPDPIEFVKPEIIHIVLAVLGVLFIYLMHKSDSDPTVLWSLLATTFFLSVIWAGYHDNRLTAINFSEEENTPSNAQQHENAKKTKWTLLTLIFIVPLLFSGVSGRVLDAGMRFSNLNIGVSSVLVKPPYDKAIPEKYKDRHPVYAEEGFIAFKDIDVKLSGIGQKTVIQFMPLAGTKPQTLAIPNDRIIVLPPAPQS